LIFTNLPHFGQIDSGAGPDDGSSSSDLYLKMTVDIITIDQYSI